MPAIFDTHQIIVLAFAGPLAGDDVPGAIGLLRRRARIGTQANAEH